MKSAGAILLTRPTRRAAGVRQRHPQPGIEADPGFAPTPAFYWGDQNDDSRKWSRRSFERTKQMPNMSQAGLYSTTLHYLKALKAAGTDETGAVMKKTREPPINDFFAKNGRIGEDGRMMHDMYPFEVKTPQGGQIALGLLQAGGEDTGRGSVPAASEKQLRSGQEVSLQACRRPEGAWRAPVWLRRAQAGRSQTAVS